MDTVKYDLKNIKRRIVSGIFWFLILSWAGFLTFSDIRSQIYGVGESDFIGTFTVLEKTNVLSSSGGQDTSLKLKDKFGRIFTLNNTCKTFSESVSEGEVIQARIRKYYISSVKNTIFQICIMWYSIILPFLIIFISTKYDGMVNDCVAIVSAIIYFFVGIYLIVGLC